MTLADEDTNSILTDNANRALQDNLAMRVVQPGDELWNQAMQVVPPDDQMLNECKWCYLVAKFSTDAGGITFWPKLQLMHLVAKNLSYLKWIQIQFGQEDFKLKTQYPGSVVPLAMFLMRLLPPWS